MYFVVKIIATWKSGKIFEVSVKNAMNQHTWYAQIWMSVQSRGHVKTFRGRQFISFFLTKAKKNPICLVIMKISSKQATYMEK